MHASPSRNTFFGFFRSLGCGPWGKWALGSAPLLLLAMLPDATPAQEPDAAWGEAVPVPSAVMATTTSEMRPVLERFTADRQLLLRRFTLPYSSARIDRLLRFYQEWQAQLEAMDFEALTVDGRIDYLLLDKELRYQVNLLLRETRLFTEMEAYLPFAEEIMQLEESRRRLDPVDPMSAAEALGRIETAILRVRSSFSNPADPGTRPSRIAALRAGTFLRQLQRTLSAWYDFHAGYDPLFTWWVQAPFEDTRAALDGYRAFLAVEVVGHRPGEDEPIVGDPIGTAGLEEDLAYELIPYTPEELIAIGWRELEWCERELRKAASDMGFGDDWPAAMEAVKGRFVEPGRQPALIRDLALEAVGFVKDRDLLTVPPLAEETWRMEMLSPEAQKVSPFFLGGEVIQVSYPTDAMTHDEKLMSMRGNNPHFSRATVQHELIPGHWLQQFMYRRFNPHRSAFGTPFWIEGNSLYWEMLLWDIGFPRNPEDRIGMLFWRTHRAARIIFSLSFHLGLMSPEEAIQMLVERVGHEPSTARAEVRRSFNGSYPPLYQAAYMIGGLQIRALRAELVEGGTMNEKAFHDALLLHGNLPIELLRARLKEESLPRDFRPAWRFDGDPLGSGG